MAQSTLSTYNVSICSTLFDLELMDLLVWRKAFLDSSGHCILC